MNTHSHLLENDDRDQFVLVEKFCRGLGFDFGPGTNRFSSTVLCSDWYPHNGVDLVWNIVHDGKHYHFPFSDNTFDFVFASHVIEDFAPNDIQFVFDELLRMIKPGGNFVILGPDMDGVRYPKWDDKFTEDSPEVIKGERRIGQLRGNPSHRIDWNLELCHKLKNQSKYPTEIIQEDTFTHERMTIDFILKKI